MKQLLKEMGVKPSTLGFGAALLVAVIISIPNIQKQQTSMEQIRTDVASKEAFASGLERSLAFEQREAAVANERYKSCLPVVGEVLKNGTHYFVSLSEDDIPTDRITGQPFPKGTVICDANGLTAVVEEGGKLGEVAYTGDRDIIQTRLKRFRGSQFSQPVIK